jgi:hypothetical protein
MIDAVTLPSSIIGLGLPSLFNLTAPHVASGLRVNSSVVLVKVSIAAFSSIKSLPAFKSPLALMLREAVRLF